MLIRWIDILTFQGSFYSRAVKAQEALKIQLASSYLGSSPPALSYEVVDERPALVQALELANSLAQHPQTCMRNDRLSSHFANPIREPMLKEFDLGLETLGSGEFMEAISKFFQQTEKKAKL